MRSILALSLLAAGLAGCASSPDAPKSAATASDGPSSFVATRPLTGSRLMQRSTDRNVRVIGADEARTDMSDVRSISNAVGARSN
jgi:hypothetical protein